MRSKVSNNPTDTRVCDEREVGPFQYISIDNNFTVPVTRRGPTQEIIEYKKH